MSLILLPDQCDMPNMGSKRKRREGEGAAVASGRTSPAKMGKGNSFFSDSSGGSSRSRASVQSAGSSRCSFPAMVCDDDFDDDQRNGAARVRIAIGGM